MNITKIKSAISEWWYNLCRYTTPFSQISDFRYKVKYVFWSRHDLIRTGLSKSSYHDKPEILLYGMMNLLVDFVEVEKCFDTIEFENGPWKGAGDTIKEVYDWWKDYDNRLNEIDIALTNWHAVTFPDGENVLATLNSNKPSTDESVRYSNLHTKLEEILTKETEVMLHKIVHIREYLWT